MGRPASAGVMLPAFTLWWREIVRFYRQPARVVGVLASPLVFWLVIGSGFGTSFRSGGGPGQQHYLDYFYPGALIMIVLFTSIFTMMSVIEDRKEGFLLSVLVAPVPRTAIVLGKVLGWHHALGRPGHDLSDLRAVRRRSSATVIRVAGRRGGVSGFVFADRARLRDRLAHGFFASLSRHRESVSDSVVAAVRRIVPARGRFGMDSHHHASEPADLRRGSAARPPVSRRGDQVFRCPQQWRRSPCFRCSCSAWPC